jgi:hypothetical protein
MSAVIGVITMLPTIQTDVQRMFARFDLNCQKGTSALLTSADVGRRQQCVGGFSYYFPVGGVGLMGGVDVQYG